MERPASAEDVWDETKTVFCPHDGNVMNMMGRIKRASFCQVCLALAKCHPQSGEGVLRRSPEWMLMRACVYVWMLFTPHQTGPAKRCKTGAGSLPNQNNLEECQTLHVPRTHCMNGLVQRGGGGEERRKKIHTGYINHGPAARKAALFKTVNDLW